MLLFMHVINVPVLINLVVAVLIMNQQLNSVVHILTIFAHVCVCARACTVVCVCVCVLFLTEPQPLKQCYKVKFKWFSIL